AIGACGSGDNSAGPNANSDGGADGAPLVCPDGEGACNGACAAFSVTDTSCGPGTCAGACTGGGHCVQGVCQSSKIQHVVLIVQENHTFENYYGKYCTAPAGSAPDCTDGRKCCEGAPTADPTGAAPTVLDDAS